MKWQVAIDGPAGSGKSTIAKIISNKLGFLYLDTGAMYRAITLKALRLHIDLENEENYQFIYETSISFANNNIYMDGEDVSKQIRSLEVSNNVSLVSKFKIVRDRMVELQRLMAKKNNVIMDGRDIGTVVLPKANIKIFLIATPEERARRRMLERQNKGDNTQTLDETIREICERDYKDSHRDISPLKKADDAVEIDTSQLSVDEVVDKIITLMRERGMNMDDVKEINDEVANEATEEQSTENQVEGEKAVEETVLEQEQPNDEQSLSQENVASEENNIESANVDSTTEEQTNVEANSEETKEEETIPNPVKELQLVKGTVEAIEEEKKFTTKDGKTHVREARVLVRLENGQEGYLFQRDVDEEHNIESDDDLFVEFVEGDPIELVVKKVYSDGGKVLLSEKLVKKREELKKFEDVIANHGVVKAKIVRNITAGLILDHEGYSCLLPVGQETMTKEEIEENIGKEIEVAPIRVDYNRIRLIVSQKVAKAINERNKKDEFMKNIKVGDVFDGVIKNIETYGAFIALGEGVEGLLHISEIEHNRIIRVDKVLKVGDTVKVQVIKIEGEHIGLSRKALIPNYWKDFIDSHEVGQTINGKITEINKSGVVMQLTEQIQGFLPKSEFSYERDVVMEDFVAVNDEIEAKIIELDISKKRVILSRKQLTQNPWEVLTLKQGDVVEGSVIAILPEGVKIDVEGAGGYLPKSNFGEKTEFVKGEKVSAKVRIFDPSKNKLLLSMRDREPQVKPERKASDNEINKYLKNQEKLSGTFADFIKPDDLK